MTDNALSINTVLISVTDKSGLLDFTKGLLKINPRLAIIASGGTGQALASNKIPFTALSDYTGFPECFGGRVKTLHPKIMGGILYRRGDDNAEAKSLGIKSIDLVICNLYDFEKASKNQNLPLNALMEQMDIGGSTLIRSAVKNFVSTAVVVHPKEYPAILKELAERDGRLSLETRKNLAVQAINASANYEALLAQEISERMLEQTTRRLHLNNGRKLRYGENPDQQAWVYDLPQSGGIAQAKVLSGKEISYNNYEDATVAWHSVEALIGLKADYGAAIVKHGSLCGYATGRSLMIAFTNAWEGDSKSAFGSVIALSSTVDASVIPCLQGKFVEVLVAPQFEEGFIAWAKVSKPNLRLLQASFDQEKNLFYKSISGGMLVQTKKEGLEQSLFKNLLKQADPAQPKRVGVVTKSLPDIKQEGLFAFSIAAVSFAKSNAVVIVRESFPGTYQLLGVGSGQPNRIDSLERLAIPKAIENLRAEHRGEPGYDPKADLKKCILASDGFFPFEDSVLIAEKYGIKTCIQPGGSVNDEDVIKAADQHGMCMIFTGDRYFYH